MQGFDSGERSLWDTSNTVGHLLPEGSIFSFLQQHRQDVFPDEMFTDLFRSQRGRGSIPATKMAAVLVLQALYAYSDRQAADAVRFDLRWKAACGFDLLDEGFHPSTLTYWRRRIAASEHPNRIFDAVVDVITATGVLSTKRMRALDSTVFDDAVARQDTITQLISQIRRVGTVVDGAGALITRVCHRYPGLTGQDYTQVKKPAIDWDDTHAQQELVSALVNDALALLDALDVSAITAAGGQEAEAVALLALVAGQDVEPAEDSDGHDGRWRIARKVAEDRVISTVDPQSRHVHKTRERRHEGYKGHLVVEPDTGLTTQVSMTKATGPEATDPTAGAELLTRDSTLEESAGDGPIMVLGDSAYASGPMLNTLQQHAFMPVIKPMPLRAAVDGGFTVDDFHHDDMAGTLTCPAGHTRLISESGQVTFGRICASCPLRQQCTTSTSGRRMRLTDHDILLRRQRWFHSLDWFGETYRAHRPMVERTIAWMTRGSRRLRYIGVRKNDAWLHIRAAGVNLQRLLALGLNRSQGEWAITG